MRFFGWAILAAVLAGCTSSSRPSLEGRPADQDAAVDPHTAPPPIQAAVLASRSLHLTAGPAVSVPDTDLQIVMKQVHSSYQTNNGVMPEIGMPYVGLSNAWLEIAGTATVMSRGKAYRLTRTGCSNVQKSGSDYVYWAITACDVLVEELDAKPRSVSTAAYADRITIADRYAATATVAPAPGGLVGLRDTGVYIGNTAPGDGGFVTESIQAGVDVVTSFGVKNIDFEYATKPILGHEETFELGPQRVTLKVLDVGNVNTKCDPSCRNVFDLEVRAEPLPNAPGDAIPEILEYR
jgi:hypothetical protein